MAEASSLLSPVYRVVNRIGVLALTLTFLLIWAPARLPLASAQAAVHPQVLAAVAAAPVGRPTAQAGAPAPDPATPPHVVTRATAITGAAVVSSASTEGAPAADLPSARPLNAPILASPVRPSPAPATATAPAPTGTPTPTPASLYRLPWPGGESFTCIQGNNGAFDHQGLEAYAWDFPLPNGSVIVASRAGTVSLVKDDSNAGGDDPALYGPAGNYVVIDHGDGTSALYLHLMYHGALVQVGEKVTQGQPIALSGGTGYSTGPHIHFMVEHTVPGSWYTQSIPISFADVTSNHGVPVQGQQYTSGNAAARYWQTSATTWPVELPPIALPAAAAAPVPGLQATGEFTWPVIGPVLATFDAARQGVIIGGPNGTAVVAADTGTVVTALAAGPLGGTVAIDHGNGAVTVYSHLAGVNVVPGQIVRRGDPVGTLGVLVAGLPAHVAVALYMHGQAVDPLAAFRADLAAAPAPQVKVPNFVGQSPAEAALAVAGVHLKLTVDPAAPSVAALPGLVAAQQPAAGALAAVGTVVHVTPSGGPPTATATATPTVTVTVTAAPELTGTATVTIAKAVSPVGEQSGTPVPTTRPSTSATPGATPPPGSGLQAGAAVTPPATGATPLSTAAPSPITTARATAVSPTQTAVAAGRTPLPTVTSSPAGKVTPR